MSDPRRREYEHSSSFWGLGLIFAVVMIGLIAYAYYGAHRIPGADSTEGRTPTESSQPNTQSPQPPK
ncbi:MAG TPA: hypothetical protein VKW08_10645 [Xanthobacteraceae bacterium]|jgi:hypothetical protein|nr:hypothetical protein [Xanthobacteraceae bacterium]